MEARRITPHQPPSWQSELAAAIRDPAELLSILKLDQRPWGGGGGEAGRAAREFPLRVPRGFVARMAEGDPHDPLLRQVLPLDAEMRPLPGFTVDAVGDLAAMAAPGVLRKYQGRALLVTTGACAVHCRYCFRRHFPYGEGNPAGDDWAPSLAHIAADPSLSEVILSGGDPLTLPDQRLAALARRLAGIPHLRRLRLHTRLPVMVPGRVDAALLSWLGADALGGRLKPVMVIHANHPNEIDREVTGALARLGRAGVALFNQAVLLRGVNDNADCLAALSETLFEAGVTPYYLHLLDRVQGAAHFEVPEDEAQRLMEALRARLPGYLVPRLVRETAGAPYKLPR